MDALAVIQRLGSGRLLEELVDALNITAEEVVATGKPGVVRLTLKVSNQAQFDPMIFINEQVSRSAPKKDPRGAMFFALEGELFREDIRQGELDFRTVDTGMGEIRQVEEGEKVERVIE